MVLTGCCGWLKSVCWGETPSGLGVPGLELDPPGLKTFGGTRGGTKTLGTLAIAAGGATPPVGGMPIGGAGLLPMGAKPFAPAPPPPPPVRDWPAMWAPPSGIMV